MKGRLPAAQWNCVTESQSVKANAILWLLTTEWRGGHDRRVFQLRNIYLNEEDALANWEEQTPERHNRLYGLPPDEDRGFVRYPLRKFVEADAGENPMTFDPSKPVAAKHGRPVRILASDLKGGAPLAVAHTEIDGEELVLHHNIDGKCSFSQRYDLYNVPERVEETAYISLDDNGLLRFSGTVVKPNVRFTFEGDKLVAVELIGEPE